MRISRALCGGVALAGACVFGFDGSVSAQLRPPRPRPLPPVLVPLLPPKPVPPGFPVAAGPILFISTRDGAAEMYQMGDSGEDQTRLTSAFGDVADPTLARTGTLAYSGIVDGHWEIFTGGVDAPPARVTSDAREAREPRWLPGGSLVFVSNRDGGDDDLWERSPSGALRNLTPASSSPDVNPAPSPNGSRIAYASRGEAGFDIFVLTRATGAVVRLTRDGAQNGHPTWSPDSTRVLYERAGNGGSDIWIVRAADGGDAKPVVASDADEFQPSFAPAPVDGRERFVYVTNANGNYEIWIANADGTGRMNLSQSAGGADISPFWGPSPMFALRLRLQPTEVRGAGGGPNSPLGCTIDKPKSGNKFVGTKRADVICGTKKADVIQGMGGADTIYPRGGIDSVAGGLGDDIVYAKGGGRDTVDGGMGIDVVYGDKADSAKAEYKPLK